MVISSDILSNFADKYKHIYINMAIPIASIPTLTGEVAEKFEAAAEKAYQAYLWERRTS